jgi:RNA polymerase-binding protein DksA
MSGMKHIDQETMMELRGLLEAELADLEEELSAHGRSVGEDGDWEGSSNEDGGEESDPIDAADQIEELATNVPLVEELEDRYDEVEEAIERMDHGAYGICEACGEPIPVERLKANPAAATCIKHAG